MAEDRRTRGGRRTDRGGLRWRRRQRRAIDRRRRQRRAGLERRWHGTGFVCEDIGGEVTVYATWTGAEQDNFDAMMAPWLECSGVTMNYTGQRDLAGALTAAIAGGNLPDVAGLPGPGLMQQWYADGALLPLDFVDFAAYEAATPPGFAALGKAPDGKLAGIFTKGAVKGLIWYNTANWTGRRAGHLGGAQDHRRERRDRRHQDLVHRARVRWRLGLAGHRLDRGHRPAPGRHRAVYDGWVAGTTPWTDPAIKAAFEEFGVAVENAYGGSDFVNATAFGKGANPMFADPPGCLLHHQASFITTLLRVRGRRHRPTSTTSSRSRTSIRPTPA